jgi:DNA polymerase-3 subunit gamma/tau
MDAAAVRRVWPEILSAAKDASRSTGALLMNAQVKALDAGTLVLTINSAPLARRLSEQRNTEVIATALRSVLGVDWRVRCENDDGSGSQGGGAVVGSSAGGSFGGGSSGGGSPVAGSSGARSPGDGSAGGGSRGGGPFAGASHGGGSSGGGSPGGASAGGGSVGGQKYQRPTAQPPPAQQSSAQPRRNASRSSEPLPPEPPPEDEEEMLAEAHDSTGERVPRRDPEEAAIELLAAQLGARAVDDRR